MATTGIHLAGQAVQNFATCELAFAIHMIFADQAGVIDPAVRQLEAGSLHGENVKTRCVNAPEKTGARQSCAADFAGECRPRFIRRLAYEIQQPLNAVPRDPGRREKKRVSTSPRRDVRVIPMRNNP